MNPSAREMRFFLTDRIRREVDFSRTDQSRGIPPPPVEAPLAEGTRLVPLPAPDLVIASRKSLSEAIRDRASRRSFAPDALDLPELSFLLWATQGVRRTLRNGVVLRTVPSAGNRHALETHVAVLRVDGLDQGLYRYRPLEHALAFGFAEDALAQRLADAALGQEFVAEAAAVFVWTAVPYRMEWRYGAASVKVIALDAGHVCQNLYLACEGIGVATCAIAAYDQDAMDRLLRVDTREEFTVYLAPVGRLRSRAEP